MLCESSQTLSQFNPLKYMLAVRVVAHIARNWPWFTSAVPTNWLSVKPILNRCNTASHCRLISTGRSSEKKSCKRMSKTRSTPNQKCILEMLRSYGKVAVLETSENLLELELDLPRCSLHMTHAGFAKPCEHIRSKQENVGHL